LCDIATVVLTSRFKLSSFCTLMIINYMLIIRNFRPKWQSYQGCKWSCHLQNYKRLGDGRVGNWHVNCQYSSFITFLCVAKSISVLESLYT